MTKRHHVVILGGGFGGLYAARSLRRKPVDVTLVDRRNFHLFQPLLYQVATGALSPANIATPLRSVLSRQRNVQVVLGEAADIHTTERRVILRNGELEYDTLIVATGVGNNYFGHGGWEKLAPGLKTVEDATEIRGRILSAFEAAELESTPEKTAEWLTFVVIGGGPTGVELAGALAEIARYALKREFRTINPADARIILLEGAPRPLLSYPPDLSAKAASALGRLGVEVKTDAFVTEIERNGVTVRRGDRTELIPARTVLWAAGVQASPLGAVLNKSAGAELDRLGRVIVEPDLTLPGHPDIFVIGDLAHFSHQTSEPLPGVAPVAIQQGRYVADLISRRLRDKTAPPFRYRNYGSMATIGRAAAVAHIGPLRFNGYLAWLAWLFLHLMYVVRFENRVLVLIQWAWNYLTRNRSARLITGKAPK